MGNGAKNADANMINCQSLEKEDGLMVSATMKKIKTILSTKKNNGLQKNATVKKTHKKYVTATKKTDTN